jgi:uncharacterized protein YndB with AHSA1/START domain
MGSQRISQHINAPREAVYRVFVDACLVALWRAPSDMTYKVHSFDAREGGLFRVSLTYTGTNLYRYHHNGQDYSKHRHLSWQVREVGS